MKEVYLPSSQISALCNRHKYNPSNKTLIRILSQYNQQLFDKITQAYKEDILIYKPQIQLVRNQFPLLAQFLDSQNSQQEKPLTYCHQIVLVSNLDFIKDYIATLPIPIIDKQLYIHDYIIDTFHKYICEKSELPKIMIAQDVISPELKNQLTDLIQTMVPEQFKDLRESIFRKTIMDRGTSKEHEIFTRLQNEYRLNVTYDSKHIATYFQTEKGNTYKLGGRVDAYLPDGVLEIKTRVNQLFGRKNMPSYDIDQLAAYAVLTDRQQFGICEFYNGTIEITYYPKEELLNRFNTMKSQLDSIIDWLFSVDKNPFDQRIFEILQNNSVM